MKSKLSLASLSGAALLSLALAPNRGDAQGAPNAMADCPMHAQHVSPGAGPELDGRGDQVMGFGHPKTAHHFLLSQSGGTITVTVTDPADGENRAAIQRHLEEVAAAFGRGDFAMPAAIHARELPGVETLRRLREAITYRFEKTDAGGRVSIASENPEAREAIHAFLRAQIEDHRTGDPLEPSSGK